MTKYTNIEREAIMLIRKTMLAKPDIIKEIMKDMAYMQSFNILRQVALELTQMQAVTRVFADSAKAIMNQDMEYFDVSN